MTPLELAKMRLTIPRLAQLRQWDWVPGRSCRVPYRPDSNASGSVLDQGMLLHDFASGETHDAPGVLALVEGISNQAACRLFIELAGVTAGLCALPPPARRTAARREAARIKPQLPYLSAPNAAEIKQIARLRGIGIEGVTLAVRRRFLYVTRLHGIRCWALTDPDSWLCQLRSLDGAPFAKRDGGTFKARTWSGSWGAWPLGCGSIKKAPNVALVEGGGDFLAACHFIEIEGASERCAPVGMLGAGNRIPNATLKYFQGKRVRIFAHVDKPQENGKQPGYEAAALWEAQLSAAGAIATTYDLSGLHQADGSAVKDLNDLARLSVDDFEANPELSSVMTF